MIIPKYTLASILLLLRATHATWDASRFLWYSSPAGNFTGAVPIGNGRVAGVVYGSATEKITLNENSVWSGPWQDRANRNALKALPTVRNLLQNGNITGAGQVVLDTMAGNPTSPRAYNPLVDMTFDFGHSGTLDSYTRYLDTYRGIAFVTYVFEGVNYTREYVASHPAGVLATRLSADQPGKLNVKISLSRSQWVLAQNSAVNTGSSSVTLRANSGQSDGAITFTSEARILNTDGTVTKSGNAIQVTGATTVDIFFDAESSYRYSRQSSWEAELKEKLDSASAARYDSIKYAAISDFTDLMGRVSLNLGSSSSAGNQPTDTRLSNYKKSPNTDPEFVTLYFNYGRHLLASSSRDTGSLSLPANLQGIWNQDYSPPWQSKYTININLEMNYWPALVTNLADVHKPLFDLIDVAQVRGQEVAKIMYGCPNGSFVLHNNLDLWGDAAPVDKGTPYMMWPMGGAWLSAHLMEHYRFTQDKAFLKDRAWPVLQQTANFYYCYLFQWNGYYNTGPSLSPENTFNVPSNMNSSGAGEGIDISPTMDNALLYELFNNIIETCKVLGITDSNLIKAQDYLSKIRKPQIGSKGQLLEWRQEYGEAEPGHRHMSPMYGLFPASQMTPLVNSTLSAASKVLVDKRMSRGSGSTGWSRVWVMNLYARLFQGDTVWSNGISFLQKYPTANLWNSDSGPGSAFQIDGNFGFTSAIAEMLLQSHSLVHLLPALPSAVPTGSVDGLVARGNFVVDMKWSKMVLTKAVITSRSGGKLALRIQNGASFAVNGAKYTVPIDTTTGTIYTITPA